VKLFELTALSPAEFDGWLSVPRGSIGPSELKNCWVFRSGIEAARAASSERGARITRRHADYLPYYKTGNGLYVMLQVTKEGMDQLHNYGNHIYAFGITEKSCKEAGLKVWRASQDYKNGVMEPWVFQVPNSDPEFFTEDDDE
jgi:hypothetical protein